ncbi:hypothetical protein FRC04_000703 [Tulasnella sp. 424]|nr:hypothetical protein FRC04_000703 [Tulasnella sp. 424]
MTTPAFDIYNPGVLEVPVPPNEFGQDGGKFYRCYDALAEEIDDDMVNGLKEQLDGLLIFAGLFAGVNSAFLALTLPLMSPDPADDTNALLRENNAILLQLALGRNDSLPSAKALPSENFSPAGNIITVNVLFSLSLTLALISSFMAVLGRQWLVYYRKRTGGGPDRQRWEQLKRFLGAEEWGLEWALDNFLPSVLQTGLIIFCISLTIYLNILHPTLSNVVGTFMCAGLAILIITALLATCDKFCPFQSPLSRLITWSVDQIWRGFILLAKQVFRLLGRVIGCWFREYTFGHGSLLSETPASIVRSASQISTGKRQEEDPGKLQTFAIKRAICTSDDALTLLHGVSNILAISDLQVLDILAANDEFTNRLSELWRNSYNRTLQLRGRDQVELATAIQCLYRAALAHVLLSSSEDHRERTYDLIRHSAEGSEQRRMLPPSDLVQNSHPNMISAYLSCVAFDCLFGYRGSPGIDCLPSPSSMDLLLNPTWKCISVVLKVIVEYPKLDHSSASRDEIREAMRDVYLGDPMKALVDLERAMVKCRDCDLTRESRDILKQYLVPIFKFAGKAAVDSVESRGIPVARLLRLSETFMRAKDSPSNFMEVGRSLRRELISVLASAPERSDLYYGDK